jgi:hypothetical protein
MVPPDFDRRRRDIGPPSGVEDRRTSTTRSGFTASDARKMECPFCRHEQSAVVRGHGLIQEAAVHRRRECARCGRRFPTKERVDYECLAKELTPEEFQSLAGART